MGCESSTAHQFPGLLRVSVFYFKTILFLLLAGFFIVIGLLQPSHYRSLDSAAIEQAATRSISNEELIAQILDSAQTGPAQLLIKGTGTTSERATQQIESLLRANPSLALSGGTTTLFDRFLEASTIQPAGTGQASLSAIPLILPRFERSLLLQQIASSSNANVQAVLQTRTIAGLSQLHPATHAAGAPYESGVLMIALLIEGGHFSPRLSRKVGSIARSAVDGKTDAFEALTIATLSLGQRLDFRSLANLARLATLLSDWSDMATMFRTYPTATAHLYAALIMDQSSERLFAFLSAQPISGIENVSYALGFGSGSLDYLLENNLAVSEPGPVLRATAPILAHRPELFSELAVGSRSLSLGLKLLCFVIAGLSIALVLSPLFFRKTSARTPTAFAQNLFVSLVIAFSVWTVLEPEVLQSQNKDINSAPHIEFNVANTLDSLKTPVNAMQDLNQVTFLVLALFFLLQLVIYCFCLIKLREVSKQSVEPATKLQLLDNEENLFDFGLYVGLGGTVLSLILVAIGIVEASLMAAYASTLFGIIFVALFKILHLRPHRRELILQSVGQVPLAHGSGS